MSNTLTNLVPDIFAALDVVSRELVGFIPAVSRDPSTDRVAVGENVRIHQAPANAAGFDVTPAMSLPSAADQTIGSKTFTITKSRGRPFSWNGEEQKGINNGPGFLTVRQDQIAQAIRGLVNEIESDVALAAYQGASRAYGTPGTAPFASDLSDPANIKKILDDNGAPDSDRHLVINTTAGVKVRTLAQLTKANESADTTLLRQGKLLDIHNFALRESAQVKSHVKGTGASYQLNGAHAVGATTIAVDTGTGTVVAGDVVTLQNDTNKYVVKTALSGGSFVINEPGLLVAHVDNETVTVSNNYAANVGFVRNSILLGTRLPALPEEGDIALDRMTITDERTGLSFEFAMYGGYRMIVYQVLIAWGVSAIKPEHIALLQG